MLRAPVVYADSSSRPDRTAPCFLRPVPSSARFLFSLLFLIFAPFFPPALSGAAAGLTWDELEREGAVIGRIEIRRGDVFDLGKKGEDTIVGRVGNAVHIDTREAVVRRELLFHVGDAVVARLIRETERNLRSLNFIRDARIDPIESEDGTVTALVVTGDAWSLKVGVKFKYQGGDTEWGVDVEESNLLGFGKTVRLAYEDLKERTVLKTVYRDPRLFGSRWWIAGAYEDLSDGRRRGAAFGRPFYSLETPWATRLEWTDESYSIRHYDLGEEVARIPASFLGVEAELHRSVYGTGENAVRLGLEYRIDEAEYGDPVAVPPADPPDGEGEDRSLRGFFLHSRYLEDRYVEASDVNSIGRTEDVNLGWDVAAAVGMYAEALGSSEDAFAAELSVEKYWKPSGDSLLQGVAEMTGRIGGGEWKDSILGAALVFFDSRFPRQTVAAGAFFDGVVDPAPEHWLTIGASDGLRGYPNDYLSGDRRWRLTVEDRIVTSWDILGIARVGFVAFADAGAIHRFDTGEWSDIYGNLGGGFRFGSLKSTAGRVALATIAFPVVKDTAVRDYEIFVGTEIPLGTAPKWIVE